MGVLDTHNPVLAVRLRTFLDRFGDDFGASLSDLALDDETAEAISLAAADALTAGLVAGQLGTGTESDAEVW